MNFVISIKQEAAEDLGKRLDRAPVLDLTGVPKLEARHPGVLAKEMVIWSSGDPLASSGVTGSNQNCPELDNLGPTIHSIESGGYGPEYSMHETMPMDWRNMELWNLTSDSQPGNHLAFILPSPPGTEEYHPCHLSTAGNCHRMGSGSGGMSTSYLCPPTHINDLPDECLHDILQRLNLGEGEAERTDMGFQWDPTSYQECAAGPPSVARWDGASLARCALVSKRWRTLVNSALHRVRFGGYAPEFLDRKAMGLRYTAVSSISAAYVSLTLSRFSFITSIELICCKSVEIAPPPCPHHSAFNSSRSTLLRHAQCMAHALGHNHSHSHATHLHQHHHHHHHHSRGHTHGLGQSSSSYVPLLASPASPDGLLGAITVACPSLKLLRIWHLSGLKISSKGLAQLCACTRLETLDLFDALADDVNTLPKEIFQLPRLANLRLGKHEGLDRLPEDLGSLTGLRQLELEFLHGRGLPSLPLSLGPSAQTLERLSLWECAGVAVIPPWLSTLTSLRRLRFCWPLLWDGPFQSLARLSRLEALTMHCCQSGYLPGTMGLLTSLKELHILGVDGCGLVLLPGSLGKLTQLRRLRLGNCRELTTLPESIGGLTALKELHVYDCHVLQEIPMTIGRLQSLEVLEISGCASLQALPDSIGDITSLRRLCVRSSASFKKLSDGIKNLQNLEKLRLDFCPFLYSLPDAIGSLQALRFLSLSGCRALMFLPASLGHLSSLKKLHLNKCDALVVLPPSLGTLQALERLDLSHSSSVLTLPRRTTSLPCLQMVNVMFCNALVANSHWHGQAEELRARGILVLSAGLP